MRPTLLGCLLLPLGAALASARVPPTLEEACAQAELVMIGTLEALEKREETQDGHDCRTVTTRLKGEALWGKAPAEGIVLSRTVSDRIPICAQEHPDLEALAEGGKAWIFFLRNTKDGGWRLDPADLVPAARDRAEVERLLQERLAPDRALLEKAADPDQPFNEKERPLAPEDEAFLRIRKAGPAGLPVARALLAHRHPGARAWGVKLARDLGAADLKTDLEALAKDPTPIQRRSCTGTSPTTLGELAREALAPRP